MAGKLTGCHLPRFICLRLQYPNNLGCSVTKGKLQKLLDKLRTDTCCDMCKWQWTLSGRIIPDPSQSDETCDQAQQDSGIIPDPSQSDETCDQAQQDSGCTEEYFCVTSPVAQSFCSMGWPHVVTEKDTPTIIAELYHNIRDSDVEDVVIGKVKSAVHECICACSKKRIWIAVLPYTMVLQASSCCGK